MLFKLVWCHLFIFFKYIFFSISLPSQCIAISISFLANLNICLLLHERQYVSFGWSSGYCLSEHLFLPSTRCQLSLSIQIQLSLLCHQFYLFVGVKCILIFVFCFLIWLDLAEHLKHLWGQTNRNILQSCVLTAIGKQRAVIILQAIKSSLAALLYQFSRNVLCMLKPLIIRI